MQRCDLPFSRYLVSGGQNFRFRGFPGGIAPKTGEDLSGTDIYHNVNFHADWREISIPGQKNTYFSLSETTLSGGRGYRLMLYILGSCPAVELILSSN